MGQAAEEEAGAAQQEPHVERGQPGVPARLRGPGHAGVGQELPDRVQGQDGECVHLRFSIKPSWFSERNSQTQILHFCVFTIQHGTQ